jgi:uncharacterized membrane protein YbhN (UPF0104 family)
MLQVRLVLCGKNTYAKAMKPARQLMKPLIYIVLIGLLAWLIAREHQAIGKSLDVVKQANLTWLVFGFGVMVLSIGCSSMVYRNLTPSGLPFWRTAVVQAAGFCINKLLPSGSGAIGVSYLYLRAQKVPKALAAGVVALNNMLGFVGHTVLLLVVVLASSAAITSTGTNYKSVGLAAVFVIVGLMFAVYAGRQKLLKHHFIARFWQQVKPLFVRRASLARALLFSMGITVCYMLALICAARALGVHITFAQAMIALSGSVLATSVIPVSGGIGAAEAGAYAGLVALGYQSNTALAIGILYRVLTFWLPLIGGSFAFVFVSKRGYLAHHKS